jgi:beta-glucosidase
MRGGPSRQTAAVDWPAGFLWGTGASSTQTDGAAPASDWWDWERNGHAPISGNGNGFAQRYADDFRALAKLGLAHHRLSIEWARIEPEEGRHDTEAIAHTRDVLEAAHDAGVTPWVCLHHFTLPRWFARRGGFLVEANRTAYWQRHVEFVMETFGHLVGGWKPVNETNYYAGAAYGGRGWPPGHTDRQERALAAEQIHLATAEAAVLLRETGAPVASVFGLSCEVSLDDDQATRKVTRSLRAVNWDAGIGLFRDGVLRIPGRQPVERPDLAGCYDLFGFSYYATMGVSHGRVVPYPDGTALSPLGYGIWAGGLELVLNRLHDELPGTPLLVDEYGIGTANDTQRVQYLEEGLHILCGALARGIDVRGFFHWTAVDNYEWLHGYDVPFGIIDIDRRVRPSAEVLAREALHEC